MSYGLAAWGQAAKTHLHNPCTAKMCPSFDVLFWAQSTCHVSVITSIIPPINMLYVETVSSLMYDVSCLSVPSNISDLFTKVNKIHTDKTRSSSLGNIYIKSWSLSLNQRSFARFGPKLWNSYWNKFWQLPKSAFKKHVHDLLLLIMEADNFVETPILLYKIANFT